MAEVSVLVQQRHVATQINEDEDEGDVEVISTAYAKDHFVMLCIDPAERAATTSRDLGKSTNVISVLMRRFITSRLVGCVSVYAYLRLC